MIAKERWLGCEYDGYDYVVKKFLSDKEKAGAAIFFFLVQEVAIEEVTVSVSWP